MIEIIARDGEPEAMLCPAFICDACRQQVVKDGNILYAVRYVDHERESSPLFVSHKWPCAGQVEQWLKTAYPRDEGWSDLWDEASDFIRHLANNSARAFADDPDGDYQSHRLVFPADVRSREGGS